jgi:hypothetical protein
MQANEHGSFYIMDISSCPQIYHTLASAFSDAILKLGETK